MDRLDDKVALVTGAGSGIGRGIAVALAAAGARVVVVGRRPDPLKSLVAEIEASGGKARDVSADVTSEAEVARLFASIVESENEKERRLDILVNNAGVNGRGSIDTLPVEVWDKVIATNLRAPFLCTQQAMRIMKKQRSGRILNIGSVAAQRPRPDTSPYSASKFGLDGLTHATAIEGRAHGIVASVIHPGNTRSELTSAPGIPQQSEPKMDVADVVRVVMLMATLPPHVNMFSTTVLPTEMPFLGRG